jgi:signal transduction histidine kinase
MPGDFTALENQLATATTIEEKVDLRIRLALELRFLDLPRSIAMCEDALDMAEQITPDGPAYLEGAAECLYTLGKLRMQASEYDQAFMQLSRALDLFDELGLRVARAKVLNEMGAGHYYLGGYVEALDYYLQAHAIFHETGLRDQEAAVLNNIGLIHLSANEVLRGLDYLEQSLRICDQIGLKDAQADALDNISKAYLRLGDPASALRYGQQSIALYMDLGDKLGEAEALNSLGDVYRARGDFEKALDSYHRSFEISKEIRNRFEMIRALQKIGETYRKQELPDQVVSVMHQALVIAQEIEARQLQYECHETLADIYRQLGEFEKALAHYEQYHQLKEAIFNQEADQRLKQLEIAHQVETARKEAEISRLRYGDLQKEIIAREQLIDDLNAFADMVAHDLKNPLQTINVSVYFLATNLKNAGPRIVEVVEAIQHTGEKMNRIVDELLVLASVRQQKVVPEVLDMAMILEEAKLRISSLIEKYDAKIITPTYWPKAMGHAPWIEEVWDNYLSNAIKYGGRPPRLELGADRLDGGAICFWVKDNGDGIPGDEQEKLFGTFSSVSTVSRLGHGLGLSIVKRIVEKLGGEVWVESSGRPGRGSVFSFSLPAAPNGKTS